MDSLPATPESWLEAKLLGMQSSLTFLDASMVNGLVSYCPTASDNDIYDYLANIIGDKKTSDVLASGYINLRKKLKSESSFQTTVSQEPSGKGLRVYTKPSPEGETQRTKARGRKAAERDSAQSVNRPHDDLGDREASIQPEIKQESSRRTKKLSGRSLAELSQSGLLSSKRTVCNCQATKHRLVNNCLSCGRIICEQEGEGACSFCGTMVFKEGSKYSELDGMDLAGREVDGADFSGRKISSDAALEISAAELRAVEFKNKLINFDRNSAQRTVIFDDQSDYFQSESDAWLSKEEKKQLEEKEKERKRIAEEQKKRLVVTLDLVGKQVLMYKESKALQGSKEENNFHSAEASSSGSKIICDDDGGGGGESRSKSSNVQSNPDSILPSPVYIPPKKTEKHNHAKRPSQTEKQTHKPFSDVNLGAHNDAATKKVNRIWRRVQHDDPFLKLAERVPT